jgi:hypothetical protein
MPGRHQIAALVAILLLAGCAAREIYWTKPDATERRFKAASNRCSELATDRMANEGGGQVCVMDSQYGTVCGIRNEDPWERERRMQSRLKHLWGRCMEDRGWTSNNEGVGYQHS